MSGGRKSQRKGRGGEYEAFDKAKEYDLEARVHGNYEALDITIEGDMYEVKRCEQLSIRRAYDALHAGARGQIARINRERWLITTDFEDYLEDQRELKQLRAYFESVTLLKRVEGPIKELYAPIKVRAE